MADMKYGRLFTLSDIEKIIKPIVPAAGKDIEGLIDLVNSMEDNGTAFKFPANEPTFTLRARDQRAIGAIVYYRDHQSKSAPANHLDGIDNSVKAFDKFRFEHRELMKEPD